MELVGARGADADRHAEVALSDEDRTKARRREDLADILYGGRRFDHRDGNQLAVRVQRPQVGLGRVLVLRKAPVPDCSGRRPASESHRDPQFGLGYPLRRIPHRPHELQGLLGVLDAGDDDPHDADVEQLLHQVLVVLIRFVGDAHDGRAHRELGPVGLERRETLLEVVHQERVVFEVRHQLPPLAIERRLTFRKSLEDAVHPHLRRAAALLR